MHSTRIQAATFSVWAARFVFVSGASVLTAWVFRLPGLAAVSPGLASMKANTAVGLMLGAASLALQTRPGGRLLSLLSRAFAVLVLALGVLTLAQYLSRIDLGIDELLIRVAPDPDNPHPGRMAPITAFCLACAGSALLSLGGRVRRAVGAAEIVTALMMLTVTVGIIGYAYGVSSLYRIEPYASLAIHTAASFLVLGAGILAARHDRGLVALLTGGGGGSLLSRRMIPAAVLIPILLGWLHIKGEQAGVLDLPFGAALLVTSLISVFVALVWWTAAAVNTSDEQRRESEERLRLFIEHAPVAMAMFDVEMRYVAVSRRWLHDYRLTEDIIGRGQYEVMPTTPQRWKDIHRRCLAGAIEKSDEERFDRADGRVTWLRWEIRPWRDRAGVIGGIVIFTEDISERKRAEEALLASEQSFSTMFRSLPVAVTLSRLPESIIVDVNDAFCELTGFARDEVVGATSVDAGLQAADERRRVLDHLQRYEGAVNLDTRITRKSGEARDVVVNVKRLTLQGSQFLLSSVADITERKAAEAALAYHLELTRAITDNTPSCLLMIDRTGRTTFANPATERVTGFTPDELIGRSLHDMLHHTRPDGRPFPLEECPLDGARLLKQPIVSLEDTFIHKHGHFYAVRCSARPILKDLRPIGTVIEVQDITHEKRLLEGERQARQQAETASRLKDEFLMNLSHELRTPLNAMLGWADMLRRKSLTDAQAERGLNVIYANGRHQQALIEDLLDLSRIVSGKMVLQLAATPVRSLMQAAVDVIRPSADMKHLTIDLDIDADLTEFRCDPDRLQQALWNLLLNAVKFTPARGRIRLRGQSRPDEIAISVEDSGIGIAPDFLPHLFEPFRQADSGTTRAYGGLGIGLAIARRVVELHGGRLEAESRGLGSGATFTMHLPRQREAAGRSIGSPEPSAPSRLSADTELAPLTGIRVLIVDDDDGSREMMGVALQTRGAIVDLASSAAEACELLDRAVPSALLIDIGIPGEDGCSLLQRIRSRGGQAARVAAAAVTAYASADDCERAYRAGFARHVPKPVDVQTLVDLVRELSERTGANVG